MNLLSFFFQRRHKISFVLCFSFLFSAHANEGHSLQVFRDMAGPSVDISNHLPQETQVEDNKRLEKLCLEISQKQEELDLVLSQTHQILTASAVVAAITWVYIPASLYRQIYKSSINVRKDAKLMQKNFEDLDFVVGGKTIDQIEDLALRKRVLDFYKQREKDHQVIVDQFHQEKNAYQSMMKKSATLGVVFEVPSLAIAGVLHQKASVMKRQLQEFQMEIAKDQDISKIKNCHAN